MPTPGNLPGRNALSLPKHRILEMQAVEPPRIPIGSQKHIEMLRLTGLPGCGAPAASGNNQRADRLDPVRGPVDVDNAD